MSEESIESNNERNSNLDEQNVVPESLLAMAKDARYIRACQQLVQDVLKAFSENPSIETLKQQATLISSVFYTLLVLSRRRKTIGMEAAGLQYSRALIPKWKLVTLALANAVARYWAQRRCRPMSTNHHNMTESLRGQSRRDYFEAQRRAMLERARSVSTRTHPTTTQRSSSPRHLGSPSQRRFTESWRRYWRFGTNSLLSLLTSEPLEEPHEVHNDADNNDNTTISPSTRSSLAVWLLRLHLAFYCLNGRYATWMHRLFFKSSFEANTNTVKNNNFSSSSRLVHRPTTYRVVGLLILAQAVGGAVQATIQTVVRSWIDSMQATRTASLYSRTQSAAEQPSIDFGGKSSSPSTQHFPCDSSSTSSCDICHEPRRYPACPATCGHVFCWTCLQQWVTTVRPECPLCRAKCQSQEIVALYNYL